MDSRELNKIAASVLCAVLAFGAADLLGSTLVHAERPAQPAFRIAAVNPAAVTAAAEAPAIDALLKTASATAGAADVQQMCVACHSVDKGGATMVGPTLYGVAGHAVASNADYDYSPALKKAGGDWSPERLDRWLTKPQAFAPGTRMGFAGIPSATDRANVVAYLLTISDAPASAAPASPAPASPAPASAAAPSADAGFAHLVDAADLKTGESNTTMLCSACHSFDNGGTAMIGPNLYGVVGQPIGQGGDYAYSAALSGKHGTWTVGTLDAWLKSPRAFAPGTKMAFGGIADDATRASVVAYLRSLADKK